MEGECMEHNVLESILDGSMTPTDLQFSLLEKITANFSEERRIGQGGFAVVYKGVLQNGEVAVKRIMNNMTIDETLFRREVNSLMQVNHQNIVRFLGFCSNTTHKQLKYEGRYIYAESRERLLCFEYIKKGSLDKYITDELRGLAWITRYNIIKGICKGLEHLHMDRHIVHMDLKPANILLDNEMMPKITDFGLSRMDESSRTTSTNRFISPGYCAPEYLLYGKISVKSDVYSLGVIIIELVTGQRDISDKNNVLRRWMHRWNISGQETPCIYYQQVAKVIEIGLLCKESDPYKRPFISKIICDINELESTYKQISNADESTVGQISPYPEDDMLGIEPLELRFPFELNKQTSCSLRLTNETNAYIAFSIQTTSPLPYCIEPAKGIVAPRSKCTVNITLQPLDKAPQDKRHTGYFAVRSTKFNETLISEDISEDMFKQQKGKVVDEVNLTVAHEPREPHMDLPLEMLTILGTGNLKSLGASSVLAKAESKTRSQTLDELIQFEPPEICFPFLPNKTLMSSVSVVNITDSYVAFSASILDKVMYSMQPDKGILPPRSTKKLLVIRVPMEIEQHDMQCDDKLFMWNRVVTEGVEASDIVAYLGDDERKKLPIVLIKTSPPCTSKELIRFDPPELSFPFEPNKTMVSSVNMVNNTDYSVGFNNHIGKGSLASYYTIPQRGIMPPRSIQRLVVRRVLKEKEQGEDIQGEDKFFMGNMIVTEGVEASDLTDIVPDIDNTRLPIVFEKTSLLCTSDELIRFDSPELCFPFVTNKRTPVLYSVKIFNVTDYSVGFNTWVYPHNPARYRVIPSKGILPPRCTQAIKIKGVPKEKEPEDARCKDVIGVWNSIVTKGVKASDFINYMDVNESKQLPIVLSKKSLLCTSADLIQFDPRELHFPFLPNNRVPMVCIIKIVNTTDHCIGFNSWNYKSNSALYRMTPGQGILPPSSAKVIKIKRVARENESEDMQCKNDVFPVWHGIVTKGVEATDLSAYMDAKETTQLPIVFTNTELLCTSDDFIQFDPPELCFPFLPNKRVPMVCFIKIVNTTDHCVGFSAWFYYSNSAWYYMTPKCGILPPGSTQALMIKRVVKESESEDMRRKDDYFFLWNSIVNEDMEASNLDRCLDDVEESKRLPIVFGNKSLLCTTDELIQFDPPELCFPFLPNNRVPMVCFIKIVNNTGHFVGFNSWAYESASVSYHMTPDPGILPPGSTEVLMIKRVANENQSEDMQQKDDYFYLWNSIVNEDIVASDLIDCEDEEESKQLPIVFTNKTLLCTSDDLIQFDPPELCFPFLPNKRVPMVCLIKMVNNTGHCVGFNSWTYESASDYHYSASVTPDPGILSPGSTQVLMIKMVAYENESEDMQWKDDALYLWNSIVNDDIKASDLIDCMDVEVSKRLPIVFTNASLLCTPDNLIQFDPPELRFPFLSNNRVSELCSVEIVNATEHYVGFNAWGNDSNPSQYITTPGQGILPPRSTQVLNVRREPKENESKAMLCKDDVYSVWYGIVPEGIKAKELSVYDDAEESKQLPIVFTEPGESSSA